MNLTNTPVLVTGASGFIGAALWLGLPSKFSKHFGSQGYLLAQHGLNDEGVPRAVQGILAASTGRN